MNKQQHKKLISKINKCLKNLFELKNLQEFKECEHSSSQRGIKPDLTTGDRIIYLEKDLRFVKVNARTKLK
ncbi:hypothetical protein KAI04_00040 [Candidatus Pacearchaeota archaeon]|nr:hypothetical protein [Candidatus Pacearchaeota archaeon]